ncbi:MAG: flavodoxin family protein [Deltaproteobacteria bacterium]|nr:flavodoxin family protein [Deltaproteobacteria bacterium]
MKILVVYSSQTGNTEALARAVFEALPEAKTIATLEEAPDPAGYDLVAMGFWLRGGKPEPQSAEYLARLGAVNLFLFCTHGAPLGSDHVAGALAAAGEMASQAKVVGSVTSQGTVDPKILEMVRARPKDQQPPWIDAADSAAGHPGPEDLTRAREAVAQALKAL